MSYDANSIQTLDFVTAIRTKIEMYMGSADNQGVLQCIRETISNSIDEFSIGYGNKIEITIDINKNIFTCRDYARSIPFGMREDGTEAMEAIFMSPHTGGKFSTKEYGAAVIGTNGIGMKGVALSSAYFQAKSYREGKCATLIIKNGKKEKYEVKPSKEKQGTYIEFSPSPEVYRLEEIHMSFKDICQMCEDWSYLNKGLTFVLTDIVNNKTYTYYSKNGIADFIKAKVTPSIQKEPFTYYVEDNEGNKMEIGFLWGSKTEMSYVFTNGLHNVNGGTSLTGAKTAITRTMNNFVDSKFSGDFVRNNLCYVINAKVPHASFSDQTKMRVNNAPLRPLGDRAFSEGLKQFALTHKEEFDKVIALLTKINKAEEAANRAREAILSHEKLLNENAKKRFSAPIKLMDCEKHGQDSILYITEGKSAKTPVQNARQIEYEAVYDIRGKIIGALKNPVEKVLENEEVSDILQILGCGIFEKYNQKKLNFGKLLIFSDKDSDGAAISNLIVTLIYVLMPDFIRQGRLGRVIPPLYRMKKGNKRVFFYSHEEYNKEKENYPGWDTTYYKGIGEMSSQDMKDTMFNEKERKVIIYNVDDFDSFSNLINLLMGNDVPPRRQYIFDNIDFHKLRDE